MRHAAGVPELQEDAAAGAVYGVRDGLPRLRVARGEDAGGIEPADPLRGDGGRETIKPADARCA